MAKKASKADKPAAAQGGGGRQSWLDAEGTHPVIEEYARQMDSFVQTMADGRVDDAEIQAQEQRLVNLMQEVEPKLDDALHAQVTKLLCELAAYDMMQMFKTLQDARPKVRLNL
jgi:hypothetical protein